ncbi:MAG: ABC transporter permease [Deltaproteobacteria bacterium]|jgi:putative ABC transport system permease protein|nr:ABC transporter permease [Deltaproteobacteria bacterium]
MTGLIIAFKALDAHRLRSILAILGIFLGTLVLTAITHIGSSMLLQADEETQKLGPNLVQVRAGRVRFARTNTNTNASASASAGTSSNTSTSASAKTVTGSGSSGGSITTITLDDAEAVAKGVAQIERLTSYIAGARGIRAGAVKSTCQLLGVQSNYNDVRSLELFDGRFISRVDDQNLALTAVLGYSIAERLFGAAALVSNQIVGQVVFFNDARVEVVGIIKEKGSDLGGTSFDEQVYVPLRSYMRRLTNTDRISGFYLNLYPSSDTGQVKQIITRLLRERHKIGTGVRDDFSVYSSEDAAKLRNDTLELIRSLGVLSAGISFTVGGLGIFSIMILLVRSRKVEIGIRRAVGASRKVIIRQFLMEAGLMSGVGGILGVTLALVLVSLVYNFAAMPFVYEPFFCILAATASVLVGVVAGAWPAWQASKVEVLAALKSWG